MVDSETAKIADLEGLGELTRSFPDSGSVRLRLLSAQLRAGEAEAALASLSWLNERGYVFGKAAQAQIPKLVGEGYAEAAAALLITKPKVIEASEEVSRVPSEAGLIEGVLAIGDAQILAATSVTERSVWMRVAEQDWIKMVPQGASDLSGIVQDPNGQMAWVASGNLDSSDDQAAPFSGLIGLTSDPDNPKRLPTPDGATVSDLSVSNEGVVFASSPTGGGLYKKAPGALTLETLIEPGVFRSPQGSAPSEDGNRLYVSDYRYGLAIVDLASGTVSRLESDVPALLDGVDGLWLHNGELIGVQNGTSPMRISAMRLSEDGSRIIGVRILEQAHPEWTEPLGGSVAQGAFYYVANGQWDRYEKGVLKEGFDPQPTIIRRLPLD